MALGVKVHIRKVPSHPRYNWMATYREGGKLRKKYFKTKEKAEDWKDEREEQSLELGTRHSLTEEERNVVVETRASLREAGLTLREVITGAIREHDRRKRSVPVARLVSELIETKKREGRSDRYIQTLESRLGRFQKTFGDAMVASLQATEISDWLHELKRSPETVNSYRRILVVLFNEGKRRGYCETNPAEHAIKPKVIPGEIGILAPTQAEKLLESAPREIVPAIALGLFAGIRDAELKRLSWSEVDLKSGYVEVKARSAKTAQRRLIPIRKNLKLWLREFGAGEGKVWPNNGRKLMERARRSAGFGNPDSLTKKELSEGKSLEPWPSNALRHSFASYHLARFKDAAELALEMGHANTGILFKHYRELVSPDQAKLFWQIKP